MAILRHLRILFKKVFVFLLTIFTILVGILLFPLLVTIYILRKIVSFCSKFLRPDLKKILTTRSAVFAVDDLYNKPRAPLLVELFLRGDIDFEVSKKFMEEKLIHLRKENGDLVRPELTQYITRWMGFYFWKEDENFKIENHVLYYNGPLKSEDGYDEFAMYKIVNELVLKPFVKGRSPWEFIVFNKCQKNYDDPEEITTTGVFFRVHHALADGFSILSLVKELISSEGSLDPMLPLAPRLPFWKKVLYFSSLPILGIFEGIESVIEAYDSNEWHIPEKKLSRITHGAVYDRIPIDYIKEIKNFYDVSFTSVIMAGFAGGIRKFMLEHGVKIPKIIHCIAPLPMPGHSGKLRNYMTMCYLSLPVGEPNPEQRLKKIDKHLKSLRTSTVPVFTFYLIPIIGGLFPFMTRLLARQFIVTAVSSNFPGPPQEVFFLGIPVSDIIFSGGLLPGNIGVGITSISYNGNIRVAAGIDDNIIPKGVSIKTLIENVAQEFDLLKSEGTKEVTYYVV